MEFLKSCSTNAQAIGDFEAVAFQAFSVTRNPARSSSIPFDWNTSDDIRAAEAELRDANHLVFHDASRSWLWVFRAATIDQVGQPPQDPPALDNYRFNREHSGAVRGVDLETRPIRSGGRSTPSSASTNSPTAFGLQKGSSSGISRQPQGSSQVGASEHHQYDAFAIYELFTSAVVALIAFHLVKDFNAIALNYRTLVSQSAVQQDPDSRHSSTQAPLRLLNIEASWATAGTLLVSTFSQNKPDLHCLDGTIADDEKRLIGRCVRIAPNGILARIVSFADPTETIADDVSQRSQRKRPKVSPLERGIERWKASVKRWLTWKGYTIPSLERKTSWVRIQLAQAGSHVPPSPAMFRSVREILWPRALCFFYGDMVSDVPSSPRHRGTLHDEDAPAWLDTLQAKGFTDPVELAQQWFVEKAERDKHAEARRKIKKAEEDAARAKEESHGLLPSSPLNARGGASGDLQSVSGVYPTPPDGVLLGPGGSSGDHLSMPGTFTNIILAPGGTNPAINLSFHPENAPSDQRQLYTSPNPALTGVDYNADGNNDDLFEDMDEGNFEEGNGITDADFNYFDEPDEDIVMADASNMNDTTSESPSKIKQEGGQEPAGLDLKIKDESADSMAALEQALASTTTNAPTELHDKRPVQQTGAQHTAASGSGQLVDMPAQEPAPGADMSTPPLSPRFIETALLSSPNNMPTQKQTPIHHRDSIFDPLNFSRSMSLSDAKYKGGRFGFTSERPKKKDTEFAVDRPKSLRDLPLLTRLRYAIGVTSSKNKSNESPVAVFDEDTSDTTSEASSVYEDDEVNDVDSIGPAPLPGNFILPIKRKLPTDGNATPLSVTSFADSFGGDYGELAGLQTDEIALVFLEPTVSDWSLVDVPSPTELSIHGSRYSLPIFQPVLSSVPSTPTSLPDLCADVMEEKPASGKDLIAIAQIVTDQIAPATLDILYDSVSHAHIGRPPCEASCQDLIKTIFPNAVDCNVAALAAIADSYAEVSAQAKGQQRPPPRRPTETATVLGHQMHQISTPYIRVRRADALWDLLPPAFPFWEPLGLSPCSSPKNVVAFSVYPSSDSLKPCVEHFLVNMQLAYDGCKFGTHARVDVAPEYSGGLVPCQLAASSLSTRASYQALRDTCLKLGKVLSSKHAKMREKDDSKIDAFIIYMINPFGDSSAIWELCSAFWTLFQAYGQGPQVQKPDLVLQIVPIKYVASFEGPVILDSSIYSGLAREVYERCPPSAPSEDKLPLSIYSAPSFQLEESLPRAIPFKLTAEPPQDLFREHSYIHIGYAISLDGTWMTVAWSDVCGKHQTIVSYYLGTRPFAELAKEIWQTTIEILQVRRIQWRICIAKAGVMNKDEMDAWMFLASCPTQISIFMALLTVDTEPHLKFIPPASTAPTNSSGAVQSGNTPGSTPQPVVSPEQGLTPAATPSVDTTTDPANDPEARLVDMTDDTWSIILAHRVHNSKSTTEFRPTLISGLLCKRGCSSTIPAPPSSPDPLYGPIVTSVNILWMGAMNPTRAATSPFPAGEGVSPGGAAPAQSPAPGPQERAWNSLAWTPTPAMRLPAENMLKEVLGHYRGLGLLARLKGVKGCRHGAVPWHVAVAVRGVKGLTGCYPG